MTVQLSWLQASTVTNPEGGDEADLTFNVLVLDGTVSERYEQGSEASDHPVEVGVPTTDNIRPGLQAIQLDVVVGAYTSIPVGDGFRSSPFEASFRENPFPEDDRPMVVRETINRLVREAIEVELETPAGLWESMIILRAAETRDLVSGTGYRAMLDLREIRRVSTLEVEAPAPRVERGRRTTDEGTQTSTEKPPDDPLASDALRLMRPFTEVLQ